jgi:hypothetical protein
LTVNRYVCVCTHIHKLVAMITCCICFKLTHLCKTGRNLIKLREVGDGVLCSILHVLTSICETKEDPLPVWFSLQTFCLCSPLIKSDCHREHYIS